jgi:hypothetical protein
VLTKVRRKKNKPKGFIRFALPVSYNRSSQRIENRRERVHATRVVLAMVAEIMNELNAPLTIDQLFHQAVEMSAGSYPG